jgi:hypothetical protein
MTRAALAAHWARLAAFEHASVASFARVSLELMALGAPPELLMACQRAGADEIEHARLLWGLARAYGAAEAGPGPLPLDGLRICTDVDAIIDALVAEACVAETVAAAEVRQAAQSAADPEVRELLSRIADDEAEHAALGWRTLGWIASNATAARRARIAAAFDRAIPAMLAAEPDPLHSPEHGVIGGEAQRALRRRVLDEVVHPAARALPV